MQALPISVLILTKNEEKDLPRCIESVLPWCDDIFVLDSLSDDATVEIACGLGAQVLQHPFVGYASQRNHGLRACAFRHDWIFVLDADERVPASLTEALRNFVETAPAEVAAGRIRRRDYWWGTWLKHAQISPFYVRLLRRDRCHYEREINEVVVANGAIVDLAGHFDHHPFSKGLAHWIDKHNRYSTMEAEVIVAGQGVRPSWRTALLGADFNARRLHQKAIFYRLPFRPLVKLFYMLFARRAVLDGMAGVRYAVLQAIYEYFIVLKVRELTASEGARRQQGLAAGT